MASAALKVIGPDEPELSLNLPKGQSFEEWVGVGKQLASANKVLNWWIGDWWAAGAHRYGARAQAAAQGVFGREFKSLANCASVCRAFETSRRREHLSFTHHAEVASLRPEQADRLLDRAETEGWSKMDLRAEVILLRDSHTPRWFERAEPKQFSREEAKEAIFRRVVGAAEIGEMCPTADELAAVSGVGSVSTTVALMQSLEEEGRIKVDRFQKSRVVTILATGQRTAAPSNTTPHWRDRTEQIPTPAIQAVRQREPNIAAQMEHDARARGVSLHEHLVDLVYIGHAQYRAEREQGE